MKKIIFLAAAFIIYISLTPSVSAQNTSRDQFSKIYSDYRDTYGEYIVLHDKYILSKKQYEQFKTLSSKENLQQDLQKMLIKRDEVLIYYYRSLVSKMDDSLVTMPNDRKNEYTQKLNDEINWLTDHTTTYKESDSPVTLANRSKEVDLRNRDFQKVVYRDLYYIARGKFETYIGRYNFLYNDLYSLSEKIKNEQREAYKLSDSKIETINRWFGEIGLKSENLVKQLDKADLEIDKVESKGGLTVYNNSIRILNSAMSLFIDRIDNTQEIVTEIKVSESVN